MDSQYLYSKIENLKKDKRLSTNQLCKLAGVSHNTLYTWKTRKTMPTFEVLESLCDVLDISLVQLFSDSIIDDISEEQKNLLELWSTLDRNNKSLIINMIKALRGSK